jgi:hypothetical protein
VSTDVIADLKAHARVLHRRAQTGDAAALQRLRVVSELKRESDETLARNLLRRHCLTAVAKQLGFLSWKHLVDVLTHKEQHDYGTLLYPSSCSGHSNIWSAHYQEACEIRAAHGGYLLAYKNQFVIVDEYFIESMGLDPADEDWERIGRDWAKPKDPAARGRLYHQLIQNALVRLVRQE